MSFFRTHDRVQLDCSGDEVLVKQSFKEECDINNIMRKYLKSGTVPVPSGKLQYGDFSDVPDYQHALNVVLDVQEYFVSLPSAVQKRFKNDPEAFLEFINDPGNIEEAKRLGLIEEPKKAPAEPSDEAPAEPSDEDSSE